MNQRTKILNAAMAVAMMVAVLLCCHWFNCTLSKSVDDMPLTRHGQIRR
ncbi:MAG: hypothetical protein ACKVOR_05380 [Flavobacteriales bacterium]